MSTAAHANAPASNADAQAFSPDSYIGHVETFSDPAEPAAPPPPMQEPEAVNKPGEDSEIRRPDFVGDEARQAFYARIKAKASNEPPSEPELDALAPFAVKDGEPLPIDDDQDKSGDEITREARAAAGELTPKPQTQQPQTYELKVNRNTFTATREQLLQMAGLGEEEAAGVPDSVLVRSAQIAEAARQRLIEAKSATSFETADRQSQPPYPADGNGQHADGSQPSAQGSLSALSEAELVQRIQYGDEEEAAAALRESTRRAMREDQQQRAVSQVRMTVEQALGEFEKTNSDLVQNVEAMELLTAAAVADVRSALIQAGANPASVAELSQKEAIATYSQAVASGYALPPVGEILGRAEQKARRIFNLPKAGDASHQRPTPTPQQPQPSAYDRRMAAKAALPQTPTRAGSPAPTAPARTSPEDSRKRTINWMRQSRGQAPLY